MLNPFIDLFGKLIELYIICIFAWFIMTLLLNFKIINRQQTFVMQLMYALNRLCGPPMNYIRKFLPDLGSLDIAPVLLIILLQFLQNFMYHYLYNL